MYGDRAATLRQLTDDEIMLIAGGSNYYSGTTTSPPPEDPPWGYPGGPGDGGSGGGTVVGSGGTSNAPPTFHTKGRTDCAADMAALQAALNDLAAGSQTAAGILQAAYQNNATINLIRWDTSGDIDGWDTGSHTLSWDPFGAASGTNPDGSTWEISPEIALAHEMIHAANPGLSEAQVISLENQIAAEMNASYGMTDSVNRVTHSGNMFNVAAVNSHTYSLTRTDCP